MTNLISGKEALIALANGEAVEWRHPERDWFIAPRCNMRTQDFFSGVYQFRLKPKTIKLNGIEVPAPFEPRVGGTYWCFSTQTILGYSHNVYVSEQDDRRFMNMGVWRTEDEIKQVVAALRQVFGGVVKALGEVS
ncbi:hypothetical protein [Acinetobacter sp. YH12099]|uniref:hypothetical protein n=1 Tax=Acinetobacter sp. YH12099 TaxID=2601088 RepID=UPI0015D2E584|nr:hypothetical protein [Acinetobacter sp. YH12099]